MPPAAAETTRTVDPSEIAKFERMAAEWWDATGKFAPLHKFNPVRIGYVRDVVAEHFGRDAKAGPAACPASAARYRLRRRASSPSP